MNQKAISQRGQMNLFVPYSHKDQAKALGAYWDAENKTWYIPFGIDIHPFFQWWPVELKLKYGLLSDELTKSLKTNKPRRPNGKIHRELRRQLKKENKPLEIMKPDNWESMVYDPGKITAKSIEFPSYFDPNNKPPWI